MKTCNATAMLCAFGAAGLASLSFAQAQDVVIPDRGSLVRIAPAALDMSRAKPRVNRLAAPNEALIQADRSFPGMPGVSVAQAAWRLVSPRAFGAFGIPYTSTRVQLGLRSGASAMAATDANLLSVTYPYRAIGKLFFNTPFGASWCTASVIRRGVIVTAAHCIQDFGTFGAVFNTFRFYPGHYGVPGATTAQQAPYGIWAGRGIVRPVTWANGRDVGCGAARDNDLAVIALLPNSQNQMVGDVVGKLAYGWNNYSFISSAKTGNLRVAAVSTLGYPFILDSGNIMQRSDGPAYPTTVCNAKQLWQGSNFGGGSSGGPWIVNFSGRNPIRGGGAVPGAAPAMAVVGVTSWGAADPNTPKDNYSSQFGQNAAYPKAAYGIYGAGNIGSLLNTLCSTRPVGSTLTYAQMGYCS